MRPDGGAEFEVRATSRDIVTWEKTSQGRTFADLGRPAMSDFYGISYLAAKRQGLFEGNRKEWDTSVDIDVEEDQEPDPTQPDP